MKLAFLGTGEFGVGALNALRDAGHEIVCAISQPDRPAGRGKKLQPTFIRTAAESRGIPHLQAEDVNTPEFAAAIERAELAVVVAFGQKIAPSLLAATPHGFINIHASLLPRYRGAAPFQWAVLNGDTETGVTVFKLNEKWDAGAIYATRTHPVREDQTAAELHDELAEVGATLIVDVVARIADGSIAPQPQVHREATRAPKLSRALSVINWNQPARTVARWINGLWSWPTAAAMFAKADNRERVQLARAIPAPDAEPALPNAAPGTIVGHDLVQAAPGVVRILEIRPAGSKLMQFDAFARGRNVAPGDRFLPLDTP